MQSSTKRFTLYCVVLLLASWPVLGHAQSAAKQKNTVERRTQKSTPPPKYREIYWITNDTATGSHLPVVYRILQRDGKTVSVSPMNTLTPNRVLRNTFGASDTSAILRQEPAFH